MGRAGPGKQGLCSQRTDSSAPPDLVIFTVRGLEAALADCQQHKIN